MKPELIRKVYFIGIGGIGMSAIARFFKARSCEVAGYDRTHTSLTDQLEAEGIAVSFVDRYDQIPREFRVPAADLLVVYTPSIPKDANILAFFVSAGFRLYKRAEVLGIISSTHSVLAVAGTHGKTTTSSMLAHILKNGGVDITAFLGGIMVNYGTNFLNGSSKWVVVEADEYDRSFLTLWPQAAVITSMDADHLDIYQDIEHMNAAFNQFANQVSAEGLLVVKSGLPVNRAYVEYGMASMGKMPEIAARNVQIREGALYFDYQDASRWIQNIKMRLPGLHNIENATAAICLALYTGLSTEEVKQGIESFQGVKRRFEYVLDTTEHIFIDDYAHHPAELRALVAALKLLYPERKLTLAFQPHLFTRTRDFFEEMATVLSQADTLLLLEIYPARETPIAGVSSQLILDRITSPERHLLTKEGLLRYVADHQPELLVTAGAGDIDSEVPGLAAAIKMKGGRLHGN